MFSEESSAIEANKPYEITGSLGTGGYAEVFRAKKVDTGEYFALKRIKRYRLNDPKMSRQVSFQIDLMKEMNHPNIIRMYEAYEDDEYVNMILELAEGGSLYDRLQQYGTFTEGRVVRCIKDIVSALEYLHVREQPIIHRDLKPENILLDANGNCKVTDFGCSNIIDLRGGTRYTYAGTQIYMAPEMVSNIPYTESIDLWNVGVMIYELLTGENPFAIQIEDPIEELITKMEIRFPEGFPVLAKDVVKRLLQKEPNQRMTLKQLKNHIWLNIEVEEPLVKTYYPGSCNSKMEEAKDAVAHFKEYLSRLAVEKTNVERLRNQIRHFKFERVVQSKREELSPAQYFELNQTLNSLKVEFAENEKKLKSRHELVMAKTQKIQAKEKAIRDEIDKDQQQIAELESMAPRLMVHIRQSFREANQRLSEFIACLDKFPAKLRQDILYMRENRINPPPRRQCIDVLHIENQVLNLHLRALEEKKKCMEEEIVKKETSRIVQREQYAEEQV